MIQTQWFISPIQGNVVYGGQTWRAPKMMEHLPELPEGWSFVNIDGPGMGIIALHWDDALVAPRESAKVITALESAPDTEVFQMGAALTETVSSWSRFSIIRPQLEPTGVFDDSRIQTARPIRAMLAELVRQNLVMQKLKVPAGVNRATRMATLSVGQRGKFSQRILNAGWPVSLQPVPAGTFGTFATKLFAEPRIRFGIRSGEMKFGQKTATLAG